MHKEVAYHNFLLGGCPSRLSQSFSALSNMPSMIHASPFLVLFVRVLPRRTSFGRVSACILDRLLVLGLPLGFEDGGAEVVSSDCLKRPLVRSRAALELEASACDSQRKKGKLGGAFIAIKTIHASAPPQTKRSTSSPAVVSKICLTCTPTGEAGRRYGR